MLPMCLNVFTFSREVSSSINACICTYVYSSHPIVCIGATLSFASCDNISLPTTLMPYISHFNFCGVLNSAEIVI